MPGAFPNLHGQKVRWFQSELSDWNGPVNVARFLKDTFAGHCTTLAGRILGNGNSANHELAHRYFADRELPLTLRKLNLSEEAIQRHLASVIKRQSGLEGRLDLQ